MRRTFHIHTADAARVKQLVWQHRHDATNVSITSRQHEAPVFESPDQPMLAAQHRSTALQQQADSDMPSAQKASWARCSLRARKKLCRPVPLDAVPPGGPAAAVPLAPLAPRPKDSTCWPGASSASHSNLTGTACCSNSGLQVDQLRGTGL